MKFTNFTEDETDTILMSAEFFLTQYFPELKVPTRSDMFKLMDTLSSSTMKESEIQEYKGEKLVKAIVTMNLYRNELCFFVFRNLYLMHYGKSILEMPCPYGKEKDYGLTILRSVNDYRDNSDEITKDLWPNQKGVLEWIPEGYVRISLTDVQKECKAKNKTERKKKKKSRKNRKSK